jgi:hypothetical protein
LPFRLVTALGRGGFAIQRRVGIHRKRLENLVDAIEADLLKVEDASFKVSAH